MKNKIFALLAVMMFAFSVSSCGIKGHNRKEVWGVDESDKRVFGEVGKGPRQLEKTWPDDESGKTTEKISNIKSKLYPKDK